MIFKGNWTVFSSCISNCTVHRSHVINVQYIGTSQWFCLTLFLFIRGLSCPICIQASLSPYCLKLTMPGYPHKCLPVSCGDIGFKKNPMSSIGLEIRPQSAFSAFRALLPSANYSAEWSGPVWQQPSSLHMSFWRTIFVSRGLSHLTQKAWIQTKRAPNFHYCLQRAVTPEWMGSIALW
jgi:hypothetical protein